MYFNTHKMANLLIRALRPLVSLMIRNGMTHKRFSEILKVVYVNVAASEYGKSGRPTNITRISLLTGLDRKQIKQLRELPESRLVDNEPQQSNVLGRILSAWYQDDEFSLSGTPKILAVDDAFIKLCKRYGGDKTHTSILNELLNAKAIERTGSNSVVAITRYYMPHQADVVALERSLDVYCDFGVTVLHNLYRSPDQLSRFEGRATNVCIPIDKLDEMRAYVETEGQRCLEEADLKFSNAEKNNSDSSETVRVGLGLYWIEDPEEHPK